MSTVDPTKCEHDWNDNKVWSGGPSHIRMCNICSTKETYTEST